MNNTKRLMLVDGNYNYAYGATSRAIAFRSASETATKLGYVDLSKHYRELMRVWSRAAISHIKVVTSYKKK